MRFRDEMGQDGSKRVGWEGRWYAFSFPVIFQSYSRCGTRKEEPGAETMDVLSITITNMIMITLSKSPYHAKHVDALSWVISITILQHPFRSQRRPLKSSIIIPPHVDSLVLIPDKQYNIRLLLSIAAPNP